MDEEFKNLLYDALGCGCCSGKTSEDVETAIQALIDKAVAAEREACSRIALKISARPGLFTDASDTALEIGEAIMARGAK